jgi:hypothetical protein
MAHGPLRTQPTLLFIGILYIVGAVGSACQRPSGLHRRARMAAWDCIRPALRRSTSPNRATQVPRPPGRDVSIQHRLRIPGFLIQRLLAGIGENAALDAGSLRFRRSCMPPVWPARSPRWLLGKKNDREAGMKVLRLIGPEASEAQIASDADAILGVSEISKADSGPASSARQYPGLSHRILQSAFRHQRNSLLRPAYF